MQPGAIRMFRFCIAIALLGVFAFTSSVWAEGFVGPRVSAEVGVMAPDFNLMPLKVYDFGIKVQEGTGENASDFTEPVRLSDFRGHKPVVLIFGSYS